MNSKRHSPLWNSRSLFALGFAIPALACLFLAEMHLRLWLPSDVSDYFGELATQPGIYRADPDLGVDYRGYAEFHKDSARRLAELGPLDAATPTWLFFGNSFVQAPGMLADTARSAADGRRIFNLARNEILPLRVAQARLLIEAGLRPDRVFFVLLPHDLWQIGKRPLSYISVTPGGTIATRMRLPKPPWDRLLQSSRLATIAWIRLGRAAGDPQFRPHAVAEAPSPRVRDDLSRLLSVLADVCRRHSIPVTVITLPNREQIFGQAPFGFQTTIGELAQRLGLDYYDARDAFVSVPDKASLFEPDWHFSPYGNRLLLAGLIAHLAALDTRTVRRGQQH